ncbi:acyl-CoA dehydrogenase [Salinisphaera orenii MK-B5]|uniref:Acyl-coenzyme A dehydrogenase n=1 Tax=Salinisphaera orenii MK-B5 TaxID=856730 RepID=A0A423PVD6_9GAMM|nr:acyl-CoA dehydrogenase [Salinisphaera orenii]ROO29511.1 acyl-CoA dehydrogenase [Salinisphaera orenii MK-B5]
MTGFIIALLLIGLYWTLLYRGVSLAVFTGVTAAVVVALAATGLIGPVGFVITALVLGLGLALFNIVPLRRRVLTHRLYGIFRKILPEMGQTEQQALEAGDVWWEAELFRGRPDWQQLLDFQLTRLSEREQAFLDNETEQLCTMLDDWQVNFELKDLPEEAWEYIRNAGFLSMLIPKEHGGLGFSAYGQSCVVAKIATRSIAAAVTVMVPNSLGPGELLVHYGTKEQQDKWLPGLASGRELPCFALTGVEVGSDAAKMPDTGVVCKRSVDGEEVLGLSLTFNKRYITLAPVATLMGLAFRLKDPDGLLGDPETVDYGITCALLATDTPGVNIGRRSYPGNAFMNGPIEGRDVFVPIDAIIGGPKQAGNGWRMLFECLSAGRGVSLPALSTATGKGMYGITSAYSRIRRQFGTEIGNFEGVQEGLGVIGGYAYILENVRNLTASGVDHCTPAVVTAMIKYHSTEMMRTVINHSMDIHSGRGIIMGPRNYLAAAYQALPVAITVEGANVMTRSLMVFGQGAIRCHPYVYSEMEAAHNPDFKAGLVEFDRLLFSHIGYSVNRMVRAFTLGVTNAKLAKAPVKNEMTVYYRHLERFSAALAFCSDLAMGTLGGALKLKESTSARLGDVLSHLYMASATLKGFEVNGGTEEDKVHARWAMEYHLHEIEQALHEFVRNYPVKAARPLLRCVALPRGRRFHGPSDATNSALCRMMLGMKLDSEFGRRMTYDIYIGRGENDPTGRLIGAYEKLQAIDDVYSEFLRAAKHGEIEGESVEQQLASALERGVLDAGQVDAIREYDRMRYDVLLTDDFSKEYLANPLSEDTRRAEGRPVDLRQAS